MAQGAGRECPGPEQLAAYADGVLGGEDRARIERHLAECADCRAVVAETMAFLEAQPVAVAPSGGSVVPFRRRGWRTVSVAALAAAAAVILAVRLMEPGWLGGVFGARSARPELQELVAALANEPTRPVEGRLTGGFKYAPPPPATRGPGDREPSPEARIAAAKLEKLARDDDTPANQAALGVAYLALGDVDKAIVALEDAVSRQPDSAAFESDLAAAYTARAARSREEDWPKALAAAERALKLDPTLNEALYNRALILEHLHLDEAARTAWDEYRRNESDARWRKESDGRLKPQARSESDEWETFRSQLDELRVDDEAVDRNATARPEQLAWYLEDTLVPRMAAAVAAGDPAAGSHRDMCRRVGAALTRDTRDRFPDDLALAPINREIADAYGFWQRGREAYERDRIAEAGTLFLRAGQMLPAGHPLIEWTRFYAAVVAYYGRNFDEAVRVLTSVAEVANRRQHTTLLARTEWMRGLIAGVQGDFVEAAQRYGRAAEIFKASGSIQQLAKVHDLLADVNAYLGDAHAVWQHRLAALAFYDRVQNRRWKQSMVASASVRLLREGYPEAALSFQNVIVAAAMRSKEPVAITEALTSRCRILRQLDRLDDARADLRQATEWRAQISDPALAKTLDLDRAVEVAALDQANSDAAVDQAVKEAQSSGLNARLPHLLIGRAHALRNAGQTAKAEGLLHQALEIAQQLAFKTSDGHDIVQLDEFRHSVAELVASQVSHGRSDEALETVEWSRAPFLRRMLAAEPVRASDVSPRLGRGVTILYYQPLTESIAAWRVDRRGVTAVHLQVNPAAVERHIDEYQRTLTHPTSTARREQLARALYDELLRPVLAGVAHETTLVFAVDASLARLPFASLQSAEGRFVVEDYSVVLTPSAAVFLALRQRAAAPATPAEAKLLAVASNGTGELGPLPEAAREVTEIAALYRTAHVLLDADATPARFREQLDGASVVHFAGHAVPNPEFPDLSRLVFSARDGRAQFIFARDISSFRLPRAPIVVLSACETNAGRRSFSEGALSLARAFVAAGAAQVVASGWKVEDAAARTLMVAFHRELASRHDAAHALRRAQTAALAAGMPVHHWAAFAVVGTAGAAPQRIEETP